MKKVILAVSVLLCVGLVIGCGPSPHKSSSPRSTSGVQKASVQLKTDSSGLTVEQKNVSDRLKNDNIPGAVKHLYIISPYSGDVIMYSTVKGKATSGKKRLTPKTVGTFGYSNSTSYYLFGIPINIGGDTQYTNEVLEDDGTYGDSMDYIFWWDTKGVYHQHFATGGQIIHISDVPLRVKSVGINITGVPE